MSSNIGGSNIVVAPFVASEQWGLDDPAAPRYDYIEPVVVVGAGFGQPVSPGTSAQEQALAERDSILKAHSLCRGLL